MTTSYDSAINLLRTNPTAYATKETLLALVRNVSIDAANGLIQGKVTVLYSGMATTTVHTTDIVSAMITNGDDVRLINKTQASKYLGVTSTLGSGLSLMDFSPLLHIQNSPIGSTKHS